MAGEIRKALKYIPPERLIVSSDCGFGRQGCNREIAFYKASAIAQGCNIVRRELGFPVTYVPAADPTLQIDVVPGRGHLTDRQLRLSEPGRCQSEPSSPREFVPAKTEL